MKILLNVISLIKSSYVLINLQQDLEKTNHYSLIVKYTFHEY